MAKRYGDSQQSTSGPRCSWPLCGTQTGLVAFIRCFDFEPLLHCGQHHAWVTMLHRLAHQEEGCGNTADSK